jgi:Nucleolar protein,Nop52
MHVCCMQLVRRMLRHSLTQLRQRGWKQEEVTSFSETLHSAAVDGLNDHIPDGMRFHLLDIYLDELQKAGGDEVLCLTFLLQNVALVIISEDLVVLHYDDRRMLSRLFASSNQIKLYVVNSGFSVTLC